MPEHPEVPDLPVEKSRARQMIERGIVFAGNTVPFAGGVASLYAESFAQAHQRRMQGWMEQLAEVVEDLVERVDGLDVDSLTQNDDFMDAVVTATRIAQTTSAQTKRAALQNALLNVGVGDVPGADKTAVFLRYIEELTPSHLVILDALCHKAGFRDRDLTPGNGGRRMRWHHAYNRLLRDTSFFAAVLGDLESRGLTTGKDGYDTTLDEDLPVGKGTSLGWAFLRFISGPFDIDPDIAAQQQS